MLSDKKRSIFRRLLPSYQVRDIAHGPKPVGHAGRHRRRHPQRFVHLHGAVPNGVERDHVAVVIELLREPERQPGEAPHEGRHAEIRPLGIAGADMVGIGIGEGLNLVALHPARLHATHMLIVETGARQPGIDQQLADRVDAHVHDAGGRGR